MKSEDAAFWGLAVGTIVTQLIFLVFVVSGAFDEHPYRDCAEDQVWAWQTQYRASYGESDWACVAIDDLIGATDGR